MGAWYRVIKTIKGHRYVYEQRTRREGTHVRTENRYVGPADGGTAAGERVAVTTIPRTLYHGGAPTNSTHPQDLQHLHPRGARPARLAARTSCLHTARRPLARQLSGP